MEFNQVMANQLDYQKLSDLVGGIVDRKAQPITSAITNNVSYIRTSLTAAAQHVSEALTYATQANESAVDAGTAASTSMIVWNDFTSTYLGIQISDPTLSSLGNTINTNGFYIRKSDGRIRYVSGTNGAGAPVWSDATVAADAASVASAGAGVFLGLLTTTAQTVKSAVTFQSTVIAPRVASWTSQQVATAADVNDRVNTVNTAIATETSRATAAESSLNTSKVNKTGDVLSGSLTFTASGDGAGVFLNNTTSSTGRSYQINSNNAGIFRITDITASADRITIAPSGAVGVGGPLTVNSTITGVEYAVSRSDGADPGYVIANNGVARWAIRRSVSAQRFCIIRLSSTGVYQDIPISVNESDGSVTLNATTVQGALTASGNINVNAVGAQVVINNPSGTNDVGVRFNNASLTRWFAGRQAAAGAFGIARFSSAGVYVDTPISISEATGAVTIGALGVNGAISAGTTITAPQVYVQSNNQGKNIAIGDDAWIGDNALANGISIRGQGNFNAGYLQFGNATKALGCNGSDSVLRYDGQPIVDASTVGGYVSGAFSKGSNANGRWRTFPDGYVEQWGNISSASNTGWYNEVLVTVTFPQAWTTIPPVSSILLTPVTDATGGTNNNPTKSDLWCQLVDGTLSKTTFQVRLQSDDGVDMYLKSFNWRCIHDNT